MADIFDAWEMKIPKKKQFTIRMDITLDKDMTFEEAEQKIMGALRNIGMKAHRGGVE